MAAEASTTIALRADRGHGIEAGGHRGASCELADVLERREPALASGLRIRQVQIAERHERGDRLAGSLDDQPLPGRRFVDQLAEAPANFERRHGSHSAIIAP